MAQESVTIHGHARAYSVLGTGGCTLLLLHGIGCSGRTWGEVAPLLAERHTVVVPDLLGHGRSAKPRADYSLGGYANGMRDLLDTLDVDRVTVVGHSFGGGVALQFAYQFPERTERLVLVSSGGLGPEVSPLLRALTLPGASAAIAASHLPVPRLGRAALWAATRMLGPGALASDLREGLRVHEGLRDPAARSAFLHVLRHVVDHRGQLVTMRDRAYLTRLMPTLVLWGSADHVLPAEHARVAEQVMPGARSVVLPGVGHFPHREAPQEFAAVVSEFVASAPASQVDGALRRALLRGDVAAEGDLPAPVPVRGVGE